MLAWNPNRKRELDPNLPQQMVRGRSSAEVTLSAPMGKQWGIWEALGIGHQMNFRHMALHSSPARDVATALEFKLRNLGLDSDNARAFLSLFKVDARRTSRRPNIGGGSSQKVLTALLSGVACRYRITDDGRRQILNFQYSGDFCRAYPNLVPGTQRSSGCSDGLPRY